MLLIINVYLKADHNAYQTRIDAICKLRSFPDTTPPDTLVIGGDLNFVCEDIDTMNRPMRHGNDADAWNSFMQEQQLAETYRQICPLTRIYTHFC